MELQLSFPLLTCMVAALASAAPPQVGPPSPCPQLFHYDSVSDPGRWTGNLILDSKDDIYGVWTRLIFDSPPKEVIAEGYESVHTTDSSNEVLLKNRDAFLKAGATENVKITVKYDGDKFPNLIGYRLNARTVCPEPNTQRTDFFTGDQSARDFLRAILSKTKPNALNPTYKCGLRSSNSHPWQASVLLNQGDNLKYICEATLITPSHVLLPAHCVTFTNDGIGIPTEKLSVTVPSIKDKYQVTKITVHPGYDSSTLADDIAVLELDVALKVNDDVRPVCLSGGDDEGNKKLIIGKIIEADGKVSDKLAEASVEVNYGDDCKFKNLDLTGMLQDNTLCASYQAESPCVGNSGSNIVTADDTATLVGIVTVGSVLQNENRCSSSSSILAVDVATYYKWILRSIS